MWHRLYYHLVWTTWERDPILDATAADFICAFLRSVAARYRARVLAVGIVQTHVHVLFSGHPQTDFPKLIAHFKGGSSTVWNKDHRDSAGWGLRWAEGYSLSTIGRFQLDQVRRYLRHQADHHPSERILGGGGDHQSGETRRELGIRRR